MCGINGIIGGDGSIENLQQMNSAIVHRGPDCHQAWADETAVLGHVRLSIIDLSERSNQPMEKDGLVIVFNGEIYNYQDLYRDLKGVDFRTGSDTEVVLEAWRKWGRGALERLRGMFSFAIYDQHSRCSYVVRDPFGIKPLFYGRYKGSLIFSSELKGIEAVLSPSLQVNQSALMASLLYVWLPEESCIWQGVNKLLPGCYLKVNGEGETQQIRYWDSHQLINKAPAVSDPEQAIDLLDQVLQQSVEKHLVADVPVNAFLSGGLDSSLIVAMSRKYLDSMDCFTIKFTEEDKKQEAMTDDAFYAERVARELEVKLNTIEVSPDLASMLPKIVHHLDEPIGDSAAISTYLICEEARKQGVKVLLSGMGADELFAGYRKHYANALAQNYRKVPAPARKTLEALLNRMPVASASGGMKLLRWAKRFASFAGAEEADSFLRSYSYYDRTSLLSGLEHDMSESFDQLVQQHHQTFNSARQRGLVDAMCFTDTNRFMTSLNLTYSDRASMAASTEIRVPFVDKEVVKVAFSIDPALKIKGREQKYILKKVAERWLSHDVIYRPKSSFTMPLRSWIKGGLTEMVDDYLLAGDGLSGRGLLKPEFIRKLVNDDRAGREDNAQKIWHLLTIEQWMRNHGL